LVRAVLDTSVLVAAMRSQDGASHQLLTHVARGSLTILASPALFLEYEDVLLRPSQMTAHGLTLSQIRRILLALAKLLEPVDIHYRWRPQLPDSADELVLDIAVNGRADALVTHNRKHFVPVERIFGIPVLTPGEMLRRLTHE
jgi:putative PIN family toxin of toxin-antitoxin system